MNFVYKFMIAMAIVYIVSLYIVVDQNRGLRVTNSVIRSQYHTMSSQLEEVKSDLYNCKFGEESSLYR